MARFKVQGYVLISVPDDFPGKRYHKQGYAYEHLYVWWRETGEVPQKG